jgi:hypothetical protein
LHWLVQNSRRIHARVISTPRQRHGSAKNILRWTASGGWLAIPEAASDQSEQNPAIQQFAIDRRLILGVATANTLNLRGFRVPRFFEVF